MGARVMVLSGHVRSGKLIGGNGTYLDMISFVVLALPSYFKSSPLAPSLVADWTLKNPET